MKEGSIRVSRFGDRLHDAAIPIPLARSRCWATREFRGLYLRKISVFPLFNREFGGDGFARDSLRRREKTPPVKILAGFFLGP